MNSYFKKVIYRNVMRGKKKGRMGKKKKQEIERDQSNIIKKIFFSWNPSINISIYYK